MQPWKTISSKNRSPITVRERRNMILSFLPSGYLTSHQKFSTLFSTKYNGMCGLVTIQIYLINTLIQKTSISTHYNSSCFIINYNNTIVGYLASIHAYKRAISLA